VRTDVFLSCNCSQLLRRARSWREHDAVEGAARFRRLGCKRLIPGWLGDRHADAVFSITHREPSIEKSITCTKPGALLVTQEAKLCTAINGLRLIAQGAGRECFVWNFLALHFHFSNPPGEG